MRGMSTRVSVVADERYALPLGMTATKPNRHTHPRNDGIINFGSTLLPWHAATQKQNPKENTWEFITWYYYWEPSEKQMQNITCHLCFYLCWFRAYSKPRTAEQKATRCTETSASHVSALNDQWWRKACRVTGDLTILLTHYNYSSTQVTSLKQLIT